MPDSQDDAGSALIDDVAPTHPDGRPHRKACKVCALRRSNPQGLSEEDRETLQLNLHPVEAYTFMCVHREEDGCLRECACWAALKSRFISGRHRSRPI